MIDETMETAMLFRNTGTLPLRSENRVSVLELCNRAAEALKAVGFERVQVSMKSEATYYRLPGRHGLLRIATHKSKRTPIGMDYVAATLTFNGGKRDRDTMIMKDSRFEGMLWVAVGQYILRSGAPHESRYTGKRGTWESHCVPSAESTGTKP